MITPKKIWLVDLGGDGVHWADDATAGRTEDEAPDAVEYVRADEVERIKAERNALAGLCEESARVLERTANDTFDGRNMAKKLRGVSTTSLAHLKSQWQAEAVPRLAEIGRRIAAQDNRMTDQPMFVVFQKREIVVAEGYDHDRIVWVDDESNEASEEVTARLESIRADHEGYYWLEDEIEWDCVEWRRLAVKEIDEFVTACFTEQGCKDFLAIQGHNLRRPFIYAAGSFRNREYQELRSLMLERADELRRQSEGAD